MGKWLNISIILIFLAGGVAAQVTTCRCLGNGYDGKAPDTIYFLKNGCSIALCGSREKHPNLFSEFVLIDWKKRTVIDFWDATTTCHVYYRNDTLYVEELLNLPTGKDFNYQPTAWTTEKFYSTKNKLARNLSVNRNASIYSKSEIEIVLAKYNGASGALDERKMELVNMLFIASLSGDLRAIEYFKDFEKRFGALDGAFQEEYADLKARLDLWQKK